MSLPTKYRVALFTSDDHETLEEKINVFLTKKDGCIQDVKVAITGDETNYLTAVVTYILL